MNIINPIYVSELFFAFLLSIGSPGPPESVKVDEITDTTAQLSWKEGTDNHSPVIAYSVQARTPFSVGWQTATTGKGGEADATGTNEWISDQP